MSQHFIIGLGSTGGRVLRELRKTIRQEFPRGRGEPVEPGYASDVQMGYLFVDSDNDQLHNTDQWKVFGESVRLAPPSCSGLKTVISVRRFVPLMIFRPSSRGSVRTNG